MRELKAFYCEPNPDVLAYVMRAAAGKARVVEIGPGDTPFPLATEFVDWLDYGAATGPVHRCDLNRDPLPFADNSIDFLYCRHVLEDLYNPFWLCQEISRVARAGYVETPSPMAEYCRGMNGRLTPDGSVWRGYIHHRYLVWTEDNQLCFVAKYPLIEHRNLDLDDDLADLLEDGPLHWNTSLLWEGTIPVVHLQHDRDYKLQYDYADVIRRAIDQSLEANFRLRDLIADHA